MEPHASSELKVYLAGPLFTQSQRRWNRTLAERLEQELGCTVLLPQDLCRGAEPTGTAHFAELFALCVEGVDACDMVVAVLDGADVDSGTAFEVGYAYARGRPIIGVRTDCRPQQEQGANLMLSRSCRAVVHHPSFDDDPAQLASAICREVRSAASD